MNRSSLTTLIWSLAAVVILAGGYFIYRHYSAHADYITSVSSTASPNTVALRIDPASGSVFTGNNLDVDILVDSPSQAVSAVQAELDYSSNLQYVSSSTTGTVFNTQVASTGDANGVTATNGVLTFSRLRTDTGYTGTGGEVIHLTFKTVAAGSYTMQINKANSEVDAYSNAANLLQVGSSSSFTAQDRQILLTWNAPYRSSLATSGIKVQFYNAGTSTLVASATSLSASSTGVTSIADSTVTSALSDSQTYDVRITVPGYLTRKIAGVTHPLTVPFNLGGTQALTPGDINADNKISLSDLVLAIQAYNNVNNATTTLTKQTYGGSFTLGNLVAMIHQYNSAPNGD